MHVAPCLTFQANLLKQASHRIVPLLNSARRSYQRPATKAFSTQAMGGTSSSRPPAKNVLGSELQCCCTSPVTGFFRDGYCHTGPSDFGRHVVCAEVTEEFLQFTASRGNDLSTPSPNFSFPGLKPGDRWCLCASRWKEALQFGCAPKVVLRSTHVKALETVTLEELLAYAIDPPEEDKI
uniref:DUF2237 domain-containing protein n=1 Tax=Tetraselmis sp. GSL018 TaxID=582737 RepID=A0A061R6C9_9CHLO|mmetsp:Transcript_31009/g.73725  ORF Transcript_31009/g.73725 Transcript_31009/m.73725 type:complete len:180 (-) Transcript_31009:129-668(-)